MLNQKMLNKKYWHASKRFGTPFLLMLNLILTAQALNWRFFLSII